MRISVKVKPGSKRPGIERHKDGTYIVHVKEQPEKGRANEALIEALAEYFETSKSSVLIKAGHKARTKIVDIKN